MNFVEECLNCMPKTELPVAYLVVFHVQNIFSIYFLVCSFCNNYC